MRAATTEVIDYINAIRASADAPMLMADCFTFTFLDGTELYFTNADVPISLDGTVFLANSIRVDGLKYKCSVGLDVDKQKITIIALPTDLIRGTAALAAIQNGILDGAYITRTRAFLSSWTAPAIGGVILFKGRVGTVDGVGRTTAKVTVNSDLTLLDIQMPRNLFGPGCQWTLYGFGCSLSQDDFKVTGTVASATAAGITWTPGSFNVANLTQGKLQFTSGVNSGVSLTIKNASGSNIAFAYPLLEVPSPGDTFTAYFGCDHTMGTCQSRFNNLVNFRGFPFVPPETFAF